MDRSSDGELFWRRGGGIPFPSVVGDVLSRRELFSICGQLVGHYPVAGSLRVACSFIKRVSEGQRWEDDVGDASRGMLRELLNEMQLADPVGGRWVALSKQGRVMRALLQSVVRWRWRVLSWRTQRGFARRMMGRTLTCKSWILS